MKQRKDAAIGAKSNPSLPEVLNVDLKGLYNWPNQFSEVPQGALNTAVNCVVDAIGKVDIRRGYGQYATGYTAAAQGLSFGNIDGLTLEHCSNDKIYVDSDGAGTMTALSGTYSIPDGTNVESRVTFLNANANTYFTTSKGIYKLETPTSTPRKAGAPAGLGGSGVTSGSPGFMADQTQVAYRIVWLYIDANNYLVQGPPSDRIVVANSSGASANVSLTFLIPPEIDTTWTYQVYRSNPSASLSSTPDDNMQQVYTGSPTSGQITARSVTVTDIQPDILRGQTLYTTTQGIQNANYRPPYAQSMALFKGSTFYANTSINQTFFLTLISGSLLQVNDTISFYRGSTLLFTITGKASENAAAGQFLVATGGSAAQNITNTAVSIVKVVNLYSSNTNFDAYYTSGQNDSPGSMQFTDRLPNTAQFSVVCSRTGNVFSPILPSSGVTNTNVSTSDVHPNYVYFSKAQQPEAVPLANYIAIGSSSSPIVGIVALRESLIVIKTDGWFRIVGSANANFSVVPMDVQLRIAAANSIQALNNQVYAFTEQGVVQASDNGSVKIISLPVQSDLLQLNTDVYPGFKGATWALAYPYDHSYVLSTVATTADTVATVQYRYNYITDAWTNWDRQWTAGYINPTDGRMYCSNYDASGTTLFQERKELNVSDYCDEQYAVTITAFSGNTVTLSSVANVAVGQTLVQGSFTANTQVFSQIVAVNTTTKVVTVKDAGEAWTAGSALVVNPIPVVFGCTPLFGDDPTKWKQFSEGSIITLAQSLSSISITASSDQRTYGSPLFGSAGTEVGGFGETSFGGGLFGGTPVNALQRNRFFIPAVVQKGNWLSIAFSIAESFKKVSFSGLQLVYRTLSVRQRT